MKICVLVALLLVAARGWAQGAGGIDLSKIDPKLIRQGMQLLQTMTPEERAAAVKAAKEALGGQLGGADLKGLSLDEVALAKGVKLIRDALRISSDVETRQLRHAAELAAKGIAEEPASREAVRYSVDTHGLGDLLFDDWGELYIDRRFLTEEELKRVKEIEAFVWKHLIEPLRGAKVLPGSSEKPSAAKKPVKRAPRVRAGDAGLPVFRGFEDARYQKYDSLIARMVRDFNANKAKWCGGNPDQAVKIKDITPALVKAHMIEESGGNGPRSKAAWEVDPLQVNVPGDWGPEKASLGLRKPTRRNEGTAEQNVRAAIMYLSRKGFGASGKPAAVRPKGFFDGWPTALTRYNGRRDRTETDRYYSEEYSDKIVKRASNPDLFVPIEIKLAAKK